MGFGFFSYGALALVIVVFVFGSPHFGCRDVTRRRLSRAYAAIAFTLAVGADALMQTARMQVGVGGPVGPPALDLQLLPRAVAHVARIESLTLPLLVAAGLFLVWAWFGPARSGEANRQVPSPSSILWLGLGLAGVLLVAAAHLYDERGTFERTIQGAAAYLSRPALERDVRYEGKSDGSLRDRWVDFALVDAPGSTLAIHPDLSVRGEPDAVLTPASAPAEATVGVVVAALRKSGRHDVAVAVARPVLSSDASEP